MVSLGIIFLLSLVLVFGSVSSSFILPEIAFAADDMMGGGGDAPATADAITAGPSGDDDGDSDDGDDSDSDNMPPPEDSPSTTDTITGGQDDDGDSRQDDGDDDNNDDNKKGNTDLDAKEKPKCPPGQEYRLFSMKCDILYGGREPPNNACPPTPTPTTDSSRIVPQSFSETHNSITIKRTLAAEEEVTNEYSRSVSDLHDGFGEAETQQREMQKSLLHRVQGSTGESKPADPTTVRQAQTSRPSVSCHFVVTNPDLSISMLCPFPILMLLYV